MERLLLVRHAESEFSAAGTVNGDPAVLPGSLTALGREQARALGRLLADERVDLAVTSEFARTRETADLVLEGRSVPRLVVPELNDIRFGGFEGGAFEAYLAWAHAHGPGDDCPGGGESRAAAAGRFARGFRLLLDRPEPSVLVVTHGLPVRYLVGAAAAIDPSPIVERVAYAEAIPLTADEVGGALERLAAWAASPVFA